MVRHSSTANLGFTLLELLLAVAIALMVLGIAIPSMMGVMKSSSSQNSFTDFDNLVQDARDRAVAEQRAYVLIQSTKLGHRENPIMVLRPDVPANKAEQEGVRKLDLAKGDVLRVWLPASIGNDSVAIWTFWPNGACEPATIAFEGAAGKWKATYNAFTVRAEVHYD